MAAIMSVLWLILSYSPYLRSAIGGWPLLHSLLSTNKIWKTSFGCGLMLQSCIGLGCQAAASGVCLANKNSCVVAKNPARRKVVNFQSYTLHCTLQAAHCTLHTALNPFTLHISHCSLETQHFKLHAAHFTLHTSNDSHSFRGQNNHKHWLNCFVLLFYKVIFVNHCSFRDLHNNCDHFLGGNVFCGTITVRTYFNHTQGPHAKKLKQIIKNEKKLCHCRPILAIHPSTRSLQDTRKWVFWMVKKTKTGGRTLQL